MADNLDVSQAFGNFSIEDTLEMSGVGNTELLKDLMGPETSTSSPDEIQDIKEETPKKQPAQKQEESSEKNQAPETNPIQDFLFKGDEEDEDETPVSKGQVKKESSAKQAEPSQEDDDENSDEVPNQFAALAKDLTKLGVFTQEDDEHPVEVTSPEEFLERFQAEKKKGAIDIVNNFIGQFGEDYQNAFQAIFVKGVHPKEYFGTYNNIESFSQMDLTQENNQVAVLKQALTDQGFESEDIETEIERLRNYGDLESVAAKHHKVLVKKEAAKLQQMEEQNEQRLKQEAAIKQQYAHTVSSVLQDKLKTKEFDGIPINPKLAGELQDFLLVDKYKTTSGELLTEFDRTILELKRPENHEMKVKVGLLLKILEKDPTLSTIQKTGITKKSNELFGEVARQASKSSMKSSKSAKPNSWFVD
jgi:hypothetical protein